MEHGKDTHLISINDEQNLIWKSAKQRSSDGFVNKGKSKRIPGDVRQSCLDGQEKLQAKPGDLCLVPIKGLTQFGFGLRPKDQLARHVRLRSLAFTWLQGEPSRGFA